MQLTYTQADISNAIHELKTNYETKDKFKDWSIEAMSLMLEVAFGSIVLEPTENSA